MQKLIALKLLPSEAADEQLIKKYIAGAESVRMDSVSGFHIIKSSIDARGKQPWVNLKLNVFINEPFQKRSLIPFFFS